MARRGQRPHTEVGRHFLKWYAGKVHLGVCVQHPGGLCAGCQEVAYWPGVGARACAHDVTVHSERKAAGSAGNVEGVLTGRPSWPSRLAPHGQGGSGYGQLPPFKGKL